MAQKTYDGRDISVSFDMKRFASRRRYRTLKIRPSRQPPTVNRDQKIADVKARRLSR